MTKSILITATSTEVGKTYISGLIIKRMLEGGCKVGYFKPALSGTDVSGETDLGYIVKTAGKRQRTDLYPSNFYPVTVRLNKT